MNIDSMNTKTLDVKMPRIEEKAAVREVKAVKVEREPVKEEKAKEGISEKVLIEAIEKANKKILGSKRELEFSVHDKTKEVMVKVVDTDTKEIVREIPSEKLLDMVAHMMELAGIFVDEKR
ncbi:MAG: flagellar protein FlaG [Clostridia bacterium]|jgi:flagellar protein FlaG|nr:flagellar protein FlaG [Clostridia bacterium]